MHSNGVIEMGLFINIMLELCMEYTVSDLESHLKKDHIKSPLAEYLKEIIYGGNDGIVTTFAVVAGFIGASQGENVLSISYVAVLLFGLANLMADGASMGLGNFLSIRSEKDQYKKELQKELAQMKLNRDLEIEQTKMLLAREGFTKEDSTKLANLYSVNQKYWADFMMRYELKMAKPEENPIYSGFATFLSFIFFGSIPLIPFIFMKESSFVFGYAIIFTFFSLFVLGVIRWQVTRLSFLRSVFEIVFVGGISATIAYYVGTLFK